MCNETQCPIQHLNMPYCQAHQDFDPPCIEMTTAELEELAGEIELFKEMEMERKHNI